MDKNTKIVIKMDQGDYFSFLIKRIFAGVNGSE